MAKQKQEIEAGETWKISVGEIRELYPDLTEEQAQGAYNELEGELDSTVDGQLGQIVDGILEDYEEDYEEDDE